MKTIQLKVAEAATLKNLRHAFNDQISFLRELAQNGRRAKATLIDIHYDGNKLVVIDDGRGIEDMQDMLHIGHSGWDEDTKVAEKPYGLGFLSALYAAERVEVYSGTQKIAFETMAALSQQELVVEDVPTFHGTKIVLEGVEFTGTYGNDVSWLKGQVEHWFRGFQLPVNFNREPIERPDRATSSFNPISGVGRARLPELIRKGKWTQTKSYGLRVYYQGFPVVRDTYGSKEEEIGTVHLYEREFQARLPDRSSLVDPDQSLSKIRKGFLDAIRAKFETWFMEPGTNRTCRGTWNVANLFECLSLFDNEPRLSIEVTKDLCSYPQLVQEDTDRLYRTATSDTIWDRESLKGKILFRKPQLYSATSSTWQMGYWQLLKLLEDRGDAVCVDLSKVTNNHWINEYSVMDCQPYSTQGKEREVMIGYSDAHLIDNSGDVEVYICDKIVLGGLGHEVATKTQPILVGDKLYIPPYCSDWEQALLLCEPCKNDERERKANELRTLCRLARAGSPQEKLAALLEDLDLTDLKGGEFHVSIDDNGAIAVL